MLAMTEQAKRLHDDAEIANLYKVAAGVMTGHVFDNPEHVPIVVYQEPDDQFDDADIRRTQDELAFIFEVPFVFIGRLDPLEALRKANEMRRENCRAAAVV